MTSKSKITTAGMVWMLIVSGTIWAQIESKSPAGVKNPPADRSTENLQADKAWRNVGSPSQPPVPIDGITSYDGAVKKWGASSPGFWNWWNKSRTRYREEGLKFWNEFPNDRRRYVWFQQTMWTKPYYWLDWEKATHSKTPAEAPMDPEKQRAWDGMFTVMRTEFMNSRVVTETERNALRGMEFLQSYWSHQRLAVARGEKPDFGLFVPQLLDLAIVARDRRVVDGAYSLLNDMAVDPIWEASFIRAMKLSPNVDLQIYAQGKEQVSKLRASPMNLKVKDMAGGEMDIIKVRGKVVLVYLWSLGCSSCIEQMPAIQSVYLKYRDRGFEVVGIWLTRDEAAEQPLAEKFLREKGATWPNGVVSGQAEVEFRKRYSLKFDPSKFLLDQQGLLVSSDVRRDELEQRVEKLLESRNSGKQQ